MTRSRADPRLLTHDAVIPVSTLTKRFISLQKEFRRYHDSLPWWAFRKRFAARVTIQAFRNEEDEILRIGASVQPVIGSPLE